MRIRPPAFKCYAEVKEGSTQSQSCATEITA